MMEKNMETTIMGYIGVLYPKGPRTQMIGFCPNTSSTIVFGP